MADEGTPVSRRRFLRRALALFAAAPPVAALLSACGRMGGMMDGMPSWMMSHGMDARMMRDMRVIHELLVGHARIERRVDDVAGGIRAVTSSDDPGLARLIRIHVAQSVPGGVRVTETSSDSQVVLLIRQHARRAVSEFVAGGMARAMRPTPLPPGYRRSRA